MPGFDALAPDQKAVLSLLLKQGKGYDAIAGLLRLDRTSVRERALDALDALGAGADQDLTPARQDELADHLLGQQSPAEHDGTQAFLETSAPGRAWARAVAAELEPVAGDRLPAVPAEPAATRAARRAAAAPAAAAGDLDEDDGNGRDGDDRDDSDDRDSATRDGHARSSRLGGLLVLGAVGLLVALGAFLLLRGGDDEPATQAAATPVAADGASGAAGAGAGGLPQQQINLRPPRGRGGAALGYAIIAEGGFAFQAEGLPRRGVHKVWLYNSRSDALPLGNATYDAGSKRFAGALAALPAEAAKYGSLIVTREQRQNAVDPGPIVLQGPIRR